MPTNAMDGDPRWYFTIDRANGSGTVKAGPSGSPYSFTIPTTGNVYFHVNAYGAYQFDLASGDSSDIDSLIDSPTNYEASSGNNGGNYATWNAIHHQTGPKSISLSNGNLKATYSASTAHTSGQRGFAFSTIGMSSGKWYFELTGGSLYNHDHAVGIATKDGDGYYNPTNSWTYRGNGTKYIPGNSGGSYGAAWSGGHTIGVAFDADAGSITMYKDGTSQGVLASGLSTSEEYFFVWGGDGGGSGYIWSVIANFGARPFAYTPPTGFKSLCTQNLDDPLIADGSDYFDVKTYTGNGVGLPVGGSIYSDSAESGVTNAGYIFNGSNSNGGYFNGTGTNKVLTTTPFTINTQLRIYNNFRSDGTYAICLNDSCVNVPGVGTSSANYRWSTVDLSSFTLPLDVTKLGYSLSQNSGNTIALIEVDGNVLIDGTGDPYSFSPDFVWSKTRSHSQNHFLFDTVRGAGRSLRSSTTATEKGPNTGTDGDLISFNSNGFTLGAGNASGAGAVNNLNQTQVAWAWDGGDLATTSDTTNYDQSQTWTDHFTGRSIIDAAKAFDGSTSSKCQSSNHADAYLMLTYTFTNVTSLRVYASNPTNNEMRLNNTGSYTAESSLGATSNAGWRNLTSLIPSNGTVTHIEAQSANSNGVNWAAIEVNGKILLNPGVIPADSLTSTLYNQDQVWSNFLSSSNGFSGSYTADQAFNGVLDTGGGAATNGTGGVMTFAPTSALSVSTMDIRVYSDTTITFPDNSTVAVSGQQSDLGWIPVAVPSSFTGFTGSNSITLHNTNGGLQYFDGFRINGKILANSNVSLSVPSIASTVRANPSAGFSIVSWKGTANATVAHGLGKKPDLIITKSRSNGVAWRIWSSLFTTETNRYMGFDNNGESTFSGTYWGAMDSNVLGMPGSTYDNNVGDMIAYCFTNVDSYLLVSKYTGNGSSNGSFVFTNFRPRFVVIKSMNTGHWRTYDSARKTYNVINNSLHLSTAETETVYSNDEIDFLSNGFKLRANGSFFNSSNVDYLFLAIAENPFKIARAR
jgi:hypothetical protein